MGVLVSEPAFLNTDYEYHATVLTGKLVRLAPPADADLRRWEEEGGR